MIVQVVDESGKVCQHYGWGQSGGEASQHPISGVVEQVVAFHVHL
jgi:hypothetical protein